jgi:hypothetical protein
MELKRTQIFTRNSISRMGVNVSLCSGWALFASIQPLSNNPPSDEAIESFTTMSKQPEDENVETEEVDTDVEVPTLFGNNIEDGAERPDIEYPKRVFNLSLLKEKSPLICCSFPSHPIAASEDMSRFVVQTSDQIYRSWSFKEGGRGYDVRL